MNSLNRLRSGGVFFAVVFLSCQLANGQQPEPTRSAAWTRAEALAELNLHPRDPYLQFVLMQLSTSPAETVEARRYLPRPLSIRAIASGRNRQINLYSIFSGSLAVQESLQLDAMTGGSDVDQGEKTVSVADLQGPTVQSHPWREMLDGQKPNVSRLAECVPSDQLFIRFGSVSKLLHMRYLIDDWYTYARGNMQGTTRSTDIMKRLQQQWLIETNDILNPIYDVAVNEVAVTSSDLFFREGTDATLILRLNQPQLIRGQLDLMLNAAAQNRSDAVLSQGVFEGMPFTHVTTPDRSIHVYVADPTENLHVRSNSKVAFERVIRTIIGKAGSTNVTSLSETDEFRYIRTLMRYGAKEEDGFVYLSDPFIRNLIGPEKKLTQRNRLVCRSRLQMLDHAQLLCRTQYGQPAASIDELQDKGCLGNREKPVRLICPDGGSYQIDAESHRCSCSHHGSKDSMRPCSEIPVQLVSSQHAEEYKQFEQDYSRYWRTFFDPIAVRIQLQPKKTRIETIVLPLINNTVYTGLASALGGAPEALDSLPVPDRNIFSMAVKLDKDRLLDLAGVPKPPKADSDSEDEPPKPSAQQLLAVNVENSLRELGLALHNYHSAYKRLPPRMAPNLSPGLSWRVHLLPFMRHQALYERFKLDEPWDSEHNRQLIPEIPDVYAVASPALDGKTRFVFPLHPDAIYRNHDGGAKFRDVLDGLSNTIISVVADDSEAVIWTRPDDLEIDLEDPRGGWSEGFDGIVPVLMGDGAIVRLTPELSDELVASLLTRAGKEVIDVDLNRIPSRRRSRSFLYSQLPFVEELGVAEFLRHGIGNQIGVHVCDGVPMFDLNMARFAGLMAGFNRGGGMSFYPAMFGVAAASFNSPVYVSIPVKDVEVVDRTLEKLDRFLAGFAAQQAEDLGGIISIEQDYYQVPAENDDSVRAYVFRFGPVALRFFWTRIDDGLYIASKRDLIGDLRTSARQASSQSPSIEPLQLGHGLVRVRAKHWNQIKPHFQIGWAESERLACLDQLASLSHAARATHDSGAHDHGTMVNTKRLASDIFERKFQCPCQGEYAVSEDGKSVRCSLHGTFLHPTQPADSSNGRILRFTDSLDDVRMDLSFLEDGLHAVVTIETK